ncbi:MAG: hypothetical protein Q9160_005800 [Pyrenula sp. 1 TL-2023]
MDAGSVSAPRGPIPPKGADVREWERKQRLKEYRIAARREKRNRKSDEKKQRKLNATILRRMTRNPTKYNKNAARNRLRAIELERRKIRGNAVRMVQRVAAVHDPSGKTFNVEPVTTLGNGCVITLTALERRKEKERKKEEEAAAKDNGESAPQPEPAPEPAPPTVNTLADDPGRNPHYVNPERLRQLVDAKIHKPRQQGLSKTQQKKKEQHTPRPPPTKPTIPDGVELPDDEDEPWLDLWDLPDEDLERRVTRAKRRAAQERKNLRIKQKQGKTERRAARDEKRRVYRELKQSWKVIREEERRRRKFLTSMEDQEGKRLAVEVNKKQREDAMKCSAELGFTLDNVEGVAEIQPLSRGTLKHFDVDWEKLEFVGDTSSGIKIANQNAILQKATQPTPSKSKGKRVNLGAIASEARTQSILKSSNYGRSKDMSSDFVKFGTGANSEQIACEAANLNHKTRRKLRRVLENVQIKKEMLVREKAIEHCKANDIPVPPELLTKEKPINERGARCLPNGQLETSKQERVRSRVELAEFNKMAKVLRKQAKAMSIESGIRVYLELMGMIPSRDGGEDGEPSTADGAGRHEADEGRPMTAAEFLASWTVEGLGEEASRVEREYGMEDEDFRRGGGSDDDDDADGMFEMSGGVQAPKKEKKESSGKKGTKRNGVGSGATEESSEDSAARQLKGEAGIKAKAKTKRQKVSSSDDAKDEEDEDSDSSSSEVELDSNLEDSSSSATSEDEDDEEAKDEDEDDDGDSDVEMLDL